MHITASQTHAIPWRPPHLHGGARQKNKTTHARVRSHELVLTLPASQLREDMRSLQHIRARCCLADKRQADAIILALQARVLGKLGLEKDLPHVMHEVDVGDVGIRVGVLHGVDGRGQRVSERAECLGRVTARARVRRRLISLAAGDEDTAGDLGLPARARRSRTATRCGAGWHKLTVCARCAAAAARALHRRAGSSIMLGPRQVSPGRVWAEKCKQVAMA